MAHFCKHSFNFRYVLWVIQLPKLATSGFNLNTQHMRAAFQKPQLLETL